MKNNEATLSSIPAAGDILGGGRTPDHLSVPHVTITAMPVRHGSSTMVSHRPLLSLLSTGVLGMNNIFKRAETLGKSDNVLRFYHNRTKAERSQSSSEHLHNMDNKYSIFSNDLLMMWQLPPDPATVEKERAEEAVRMSIVFLLNG